MHVSVCVWNFLRVTEKPHRASAASQEKKYLHLMEEQKPAPNNADFYSSQEVYPSEKTWSARE